MNYERRSLSPSQLVMLGALLIFAIAFAAVVTLAKMMG